jgi:sialate O-acetylesterase
MLASAQTLADAKGKWSANLPPLPGGTAGELHITTGTEPAVILHDVLVGEAWLCSGQSNMGYAINNPNTPPEWISRAQKEASDANGAIRFFNAGDRVGGWQIGRPETVGVCSAVAWNLAVALREKLKEPIGLVVQTLPGTPVEAWIPKADVDACEIGRKIEKRYQDFDALAPEREKQYEEADTAWLKANPTPDLQTRNKSNRPRKPGRSPAVGWCYYGWIKDLVPYTVKGVIWFQANGTQAQPELIQDSVGHPDEYGELIKVLIKSWRRMWGVELPFYYVEMENMLPYLQKDPVHYNWLPLLREQQEGALELPATDVACSIDLATVAGILHFPNKKPVGQRLALLALSNLYGFPCEAHSPQYESFAIEGNKVRVHFNYADGLRVRGRGKMIGFAIRGATGDWVWADGKIEGRDVVLSSDQAPQPAAARYAWAANPLISVENGNGLPLRPFRTDKSSPQ